MALALLRDGGVSLFCAPHSPSPTPSHTSRRGAGWANQLLLRALFSPAHPSAPRGALHPSEHCFIVRGLRARKLAARLAHLRRTDIIFSILTSFTSQAGSEKRPSTARVERGPSEAARSASKEGPPHCQPVTSYPFSCRHRLTKFV